MPSVIYSFTYFISEDTDIDNLLLDNMLGHKVEDMVIVKRRMINRSKYYIGKPNMGAHVHLLEG